jgi:hypothetical protein
MGPMGPAGATGVAGPAGANGATGPAGVAGPTGSTGPAGKDGATGPQGNTGASGATGAQGPVGPKGDTGAAGADGAQGPVGPAGPAGSTGPAGSNATLPVTKVASGFFTIASGVVTPGWMYGTSSVVRLGTGYYRVFFPAARANTNYRVITDTRDPTNITSGRTVAKTATYFEIKVTQLAPTILAAIDPSEVSFDVEAQ